MLRRILSTKNKARQLHRMMLGQLLAHDLLHDEKRRIFQSNSLLLAEREGYKTAKISFRYRIFLPGVRRFYTYGDVSDFSPAWLTARLLSSLIDNSFLPS